MNKRVHLEVVDVGANRPDCRHAEHTAIVWHAGPGGPLLEYECRLCGRRIRERIDPKESLWPAQDFVL